MHSSARIIIVVAAVSLLQACSREQNLRCVSEGSYGEAQSADRLRVPDDLSVPEQADALVVPEVAPPIDDDPDRCLEFSPALTEGAES